ncbi:PREDICTED: Down syndrome cell adhesion molecule-like [Wasmannia auropunctata]|uniref:Down syndrome cell adhesion molecule-like n=1 Tax=Wasmannia auropunctata TaxID=64793 RepID=UPI0005EFB31E|nr:PREDICTED: Down syndrome cell adhesion molecule-like [Wasmannia auropunctata]
MNAGEFANLQCIVSSGDLPLNIRWSYPGEEMGGSSGVLAKKVADRVSMLMISVITARHAGEYVCTAENAAGTASHSTVLTVNGSGLSVPREHSLFYSSVAFCHVPFVSHPLHTDLANSTVCFPFVCHASSASMLLKSTAYYLNTPKASVRSFSMGS